jgi:hypothetical protein
MTNSDYPWEPPLAGTEAEHLAGTLDRLRTTFRWKADDLDAAGLQTRIGASTLTLGGPRHDPGRVIHGPLRPPILDGLAAFVVDALPGHWGSPG